MFPLKNVISLENKHTVGSRWGGVQLLWVLRGCEAPEPCRGVRGNPPPGKFKNIHVNGANLKYLGRI